MKTTQLLLLEPLVWPSLGVATPAQPKPAPALTWEQSQRTNVADDYKYARFTLVGRFLAPPPNATTQRPAVVVDCVPANESPRDRGTFLAGKLVVGTPLKIVYVEPSEILTGISYFPKIDLQIRTDNGKRQENKQWSPGADSTSATISKNSLEEILHAHSVAIVANDTRGRPLAMQFDIPDPAIVEQGCHLSVR